MTDVEVIDGDPGTDLEVRGSHATALAVGDEPVTADDLIARLAVIKDAMARAMEKDVDYGVIPGTGSKPTLLKPGAEKLSVMFKLDIQPENEKVWHDDGHLTVISRAIVFHAPTGTRLGAGEGICSTRESKYGWRQGQRVCPTCGKPAIIKGKQEYGGGWVCFKKKDGCGAKFADTDPAITGQSVERIPNPDLADTYNTVDKMASKRARIDAVLAVTGASALFTQDVETSAGGPSGPAEAPAGAAQKPAASPSVPSPAEKPVRMKDKRQNAAIHALLAEIGLDDAQYRTALKDTYGVESSNDLTFDQAEDLIARLREAKRLAGVA